MPARGPTSRIAGFFADAASRHFGWVSLLVYLAFVFAIALLVHALVEIPLTRFARSAWRRHRRASAKPAADEALIKVGEAR